MSLIELVTPSGDGDGIEKSPGELYAMLKSNPAFKSDVDKLVKNPKALGHLLRKIEKSSGKYKDLVKHKGKHRTRGALYQINRAKYKDNDRE